MKRILFVTIASLILALSIASSANSDAGDEPTFKPQYYMVPMGGASAP